MYKKFKKDPYFLQKYYVASFVLLVLACLGAFFILDIESEILYWLPVCILFSSTSFISILISLFVSALLCWKLNVDFSSLKLLVMLFCGIYSGIWANVLIHNASHGSIKPRWLNRLVGEIVGIQLLSGFPGFAIIHIEHHRHSDDLEKDPHPNPPNTSFWEYIDKTRAQLRICFGRLYTETWGNNENYSKSWKRIRPLIPLNRIARAILILIILGPLYFTYIFIVSHITTQLAFGVINYYSHMPKKDGLTQIVNLDHNIVFKVLNRCFSEAFYHKNHHEKPYLFNPMKRTD